jgi:hypothetical protein
MISVLFVKPSPYPFYPNVKHRLKHSSPVSNIRVAGRRLLKRVELVTHKNTQHIVFNKKWGCGFKKIVLRIFYIEYLSIFGGDFAPIVVKLWGCLLCLFCGLGSLVNLVY